MEPSIHPSLSVPVSGASQSQNALNMVSYPNDFSLGKLVLCESLTNSSPDELIRRNVVAGVPQSHRLLFPLSTSSVLKARFARFEHPLPNPNPRESDERSVYFREGVTRIYWWYRWRQCNPTKHEGMTVKYISKRKKKKKNKVKRIRWKISIF